MSQIDAVLYRLCKQLYPNEYRNAATRFITKLPKDLNEKIHSYRDIDDLSVELGVVKSLLGYTSDERRNNILDELIHHRDHGSITYLRPNKIHSDKQIMKVAVAMIPSFMVFVDRTFQDDEEFVMLALKRGETLCTVSERFRDDKRYVKFAIESAGPLALQYASPRLQEDPELITEAESHPDATEIRKHPNFDYPASWAADEMAGDLMLSVGR